MTTNTVDTSKMSKSELQQYVDRLTSQLSIAQATPAKQTGTLSFKVSVPRLPGTNGPTDKGSQGGGINIYGINARWPVHLYADQACRLIDAVDDLVRFMRTNFDDLSHKTPETRAKVEAWIEDYFVDEIFPLPEQPATTEEPNPAA